jgi:hypothetical protein
MKAVMKLWFPNEKYRYKKKSKKMKKKKTSYANIKFPRKNCVAVCWLIAWLVGWLVSCSIR